MRRLITLTAALAYTFAAFAYDQEIRDIDISVKLYPQGQALISETWDICTGAGTEWYLVRDNLGDIRIEDFSVTDERGTLFTNIGEWDVDRSLSQKAGKCGIVHKSNGGCELCWGLGSYGDHLFRATYVMTNAVKSLNDCDDFHIQLVSPGLSACPKHVKVTIEGTEVQLDTTCTRAWGFGFEGNVSFTEDGKVVYESTTPFRSNSSVIALLRFEKGMFDSPSIRDTDFQTVLDKAFEGSSYVESDNSISDILLGLVAIFTFFLPVALCVYLASLSGKFNKKRILGVKTGQVDWFRDIPYGGDLAMTQYTLDRMGEINKSNTMAEALILRMIYGGQLKVQKDGKGKIEIAFGDGRNLEGLSPEARQLYAMMNEASGDDEILQDKEFSRWARNNKTRIRNWATGFESRGKTALKDRGHINGNKYTDIGKAGAREAYGLKKFLKEFTLIEDKETIEVHMWQEYLVFAALFGIADKVAKELKDIDTTVAEEVVVGDYTTLANVLRMTNSLSRSITDARYVAPSSSGRTGGFGGGASFGGGGGFSGGGFGGGCR